MELKILDVYINQWGFGFVHVLFMIYLIYVWKKLIIFVLEIVGYVI